MQLHTVSVKANIGSYLLVKESPEHGQRDVEEQHPHHHLHLGNQEFLEPNIKGLEFELHWLYCLYLHLLVHVNSTYVVFLLSPVHPVGPLGVFRTTMPKAVLDSKLQIAERTLHVNFAHTGMHCVF